MPGKRRPSHTKKGRRLRQRRARQARYLAELEASGLPGHPCRFCPTVLPTERGRKVHESRQHAGGVLP